MAPARESVGIIGIGAIGLPVARNLLKSGFRVIGFSLDNLEAFAAAGGEIAKDPKEVARSADVVIDCLPKETIFEAVMTGPEGIREVMRPGQIVASLSTYPGEFKRSQAALFAEREVVLLECEVSGTPPMVAERKGVVFVSGDKKAADRCMPIFQGFADTSFYLGAFGNSLTMKIVANHLVAINNLGVAEAIALGVKAGLDPASIVKVVGPGAGGSVMFNLRAPMMAERRFVPAPGPLETFDKYVDLILSLAVEVGAATPLMDAAAAAYRQAIAEGRGKQDIAAMFEVVEAMPRQSHSNAG